MFSNFSADFNTITRESSDLNKFCLLTPDQQLLLEKCGNVLDASAEIYLPPNWDPKTITCRGNFFSGKIVLNCDNSVISNSSLRNVFLNGSANHIRDCAHIESTYIVGNCTLVGNGQILPNLKKKFGVGSPLVMCEETGGRKIFTNPENISFASIDKAISVSRERLVQYNAESLCVAENLNFGLFTGNFIDKNTQILRCIALESVWVGEGVVLVNADISASIVGSASEVRNAVVHHSILCPLVSVTNFALVENSVLFPHSKVGVHAKVVHSVIGSYSHLESGECVSSLIGPFVGFHHQSLCIATYWPQGRGNIGYGANVGSNHTGKAPDQELFAGEGVFFGLATIVKFPANFLRAPYTLIASGVVCLPQVVEFPFSLINSRSSSVNEIVPGWMLADNMFALMRNESKFESRQDAFFPVEWRIFRPEIMQLVRTARDRLKNCTAIKDEYSERDIAGLGKNILTESNRKRAIDSYSFVLRWFALREFFRSGEISDFFQSENLNSQSPKSLLKEFAQMDQAMATSCVVSKSKDDVRGRKIIGDSYAEFHAPANTHPVCVAAISKTKAVNESVEKMVSKL